MNMILLTPLSFPSIIYALERHHQPRGTSLLNRKGKIFAGATEFLSLGNSGTTNLFSAAPDLPVHSPRNGGSGRERGKIISGICSDYLKCSEDMSFQCGNVFFEMICSYDVLSTCHAM